MKPDEVVPGLYSLKLRYVNAFLLEVGDGLVLIDTGMAGMADRILSAIASLHYERSDLKHILVTHCHADHAGSLAALVRATGAKTCMHPHDAAMVRTGDALRPLVPAPGILNALLLRLAAGRAPARVEPVEIDRDLQDGETLPLADGLRVIHIPGHCAGQVAFVWPRHGGVLLAADAAANVLGLQLSPGYEDVALGLRSLKKLAALDFEIACFGHGRPIRRDASARFRAQWAPDLRREPTAA